MIAVRTCIGCRSRAFQPVFLRIVVTQVGAVVDDHRTLPGRGAWLHPNLECFTAAVRRKAFGRALRHTGELDLTNVENRLNG